MTDIAKIAEGLTEAQREAVLRLGADRYRPARELKVSGATLYSLWNRSLGPNLEAPNTLVFRDYVDYPRLAYAYKLTDLGLAVRAHLEGER